MEVQPLCNTWRADHFEICTTLRISTSNYFENDFASHPGIELCYTVGSSRYHRRVRGKSWYMVPGQLMVINGLEEHVEECAKNPTIPDIRSVIIEPQFIKSLFSETTLDPNEWMFDQILVPLTPSIRGCLDALFAFVAAPGISRFAYDCLLTELLIEIALGTRNSASDHLKHLQRTGHFPKGFVKAKQCIYEGVCSEDLDLDEIARRAGVSKFHFIRDFKRCVGVSPIRYVNAMRVDFVKQKLAGTSAPVSRIAGEMGYLDLSTFNKMFKKVSGVTPSQYREMVR
jgi:AraC-like DNA-binding protein